MSNYTPTKDALQEADDIINRLKTHGVDYTAHREEIAKCFDNELWEGNWDVTTDIGVAGVRELRLVQEDEYDQHMNPDDEDYPSWSSMLFQAGAYVWFADAII